MTELAYVWLGIALGAGSSSVVWYAAYSTCRATRGSYARALLRIATARNLETAQSLAERTLDPMRPPPKRGLQ
jgi:hypothetical protein